MDQEKHFSYLDSLKGLAILGVIFVHSGANSLPGNWASLADLGYLGVQIFFIISGFLAFLSIAHAMPQRSNLSIKGIRSWYWKRYLRLFPVYYLAIITALLTGTWSTYWLGAETKVSILNILSHVFFIHGFFPNYCNSILSVEWYLGSLALYYLLTPLLYYLIDSAKKAAAAMIVLIMLTPVMEKVFYFLPGTSAEQQVFQSFIHNQNPFHHLPVYMMGIFLYFLLQKTEMRSGHSRLLSWSLLLFALFMLAGQMLDKNQLFHISNGVLYGLWSFLIIISLAFDTNPILDNAVLRFCGRYSYPVYLFHYIWLILYERFVPPQGTREILTEFVISVPVLFFLGFIITKWLDQPIRNLLKRLHIG